MTKLYTEQEQDQFLKLIWEKTEPELLIFYVSSNTLELWEFTELSELAKRLVPSSVFHESSRLSSRFTRLIRQLLQGGSVLIYGAVPSLIDNLSFHYFIGRDKLLYSQSEEFLVYAEWHKTYGIVNQIDSLDLTQAIAETQTLLRTHLLITND